MYVICRFSEYKRFRANSIFIYFIFEAPPNFNISLVKKKGAGRSENLTTRLVILSAAQFTCLCCVFAVSDILSFIVHLVYSFNFFICFVRLVLILTLL